jgi:hypothetical protein
MVIPTQQPSALEAEVKLTQIEPNLCHLAYLLRRGRTGSRYLHSNVLC